LTLLLNEYIIVVKYGGGEMNKIEMFLKNNKNNILAIYCILSLFAWTYILIELPVKKLMMFLFILFAISIFGVFIAWIGNDKSSY
jgi:hypothetical protein